MEKVMPGLLVSKETSENIMSTYESDLARRSQNVDSQEMKMNNVELRDHIKRSITELQAEISLTANDTQVFPR